MTSLENEREWAQKQQEKINFINKQLKLKRKVETNFEELNDAMREYLDTSFHFYLGEPVLSDFYTPSNEQIDREVVFIVLSMTGTGGVL